MILKSCTGIVRWKIWVGLSSSDVGSFAHVTIFCEGILQKKKERVSERRMKKNVATFLAETPKLIDEELLESINSMLKYFMSPNDFLLERVCTRCKHAKIARPTINFIEPQVHPLFPPHITRIATQYITVLSQRLRSIQSSVWSMPFFTVSMCLWSIAVTIPIFKFIHSF
jgi:hypothetical protein